ncbi:MAG TPA: cell division protein FtsA [Gammaproteobacteria bacterium]|nr:cell division protein FtsA [Gammaproteobacteria bacterium]HRA42207.1 cell division protein FtsA [Gammaproteobacteria bacterium]
MSNDRNLIVGLDIGTSKVVAIVAAVNTVNGEETFDIIGVGMHASQGIKKGMIVSMDAAVQSIQQAIEEAEYAAGCKIHAVYTGIAGSHIRCLNSHGIVAIRGQAVTSEDVERVMDAAKAVLIPADQKILHVLPQAFSIDNQEGVRDPIGLSGVRLEADIHMVMGSINAAESTVACIRRCGLEVDDIILSALASSYAVLTEDEKQLGVCLIDIGAGTTDIAVFADGYLKHSAVIPVAGDLVTNDIAVALRAPTMVAEQIKIQYACALREMVDPDEMVEIPTIGDRSQKQILRMQLAEVVEPRFEELFSLVQAELCQLGLENALGAGVVITGGSAHMKGIVELAEAVFQLPVKCGAPRNISGLLDVVQNPVYATAVGLLEYGYQAAKQQRAEQFASQGFKRVFGRVKHWFQRNI